jgi:O-antigen/teichoic acid export membrane protein
MPRYSVSSRNLAKDSALTLAAPPSSAFDPIPSGPRLADRVASQGALLFSGFAVGQLCSFLRNALIGHTLARGDFGIAASLTLLLQLVESLTDLGADRLIVQSPQGDDARFVSSAHSVLIARGLLTSIVLYFAAGPFAQFLKVSEAQWAFEFIALVPLIKGFLHLDTRRAQRQLNNRPVVLSDVAPQVFALLLTVPVLSFSPSYGAVTVLALFQASASVLSTHALSERPYRIAIDFDSIKRLVIFGWPIWLSAFPLVAVYQGDRILIGRQFGMEALAGYSAAFLMTMVPGQTMARVANALMLPMLSSEQGREREFNLRYVRFAEANSVVAALYLTVFILAGGLILPLAFGTQYADLGMLTAWLAVMWSLRMLQAVPGMALMAHGQTRPFLIAGLIRAAALPLAVLLALSGAGLETIAAVGVGGELASFAYAAQRTGAINPDLRNATWRANIWLIVVALISALLLVVTPQSAIIPVTVLMLACVVGFALVAIPSTRQIITSLIETGSQGLSSFRSNLTASKKAA